MAPTTLRSTICALVASLAIFGGVVAYTDDRKPGTQQMPTGVVSAVTSARKHSVALRTSAATQQARVASHVIVVGMHTQRGAADEQLDDLRALDIDGFGITSTATRRGTVYQVVSSPQPAHGLHRLIAQLTDEGITYYFTAHQAG